MTQRSYCFTAYNEPELKLGSQEIIRYCIYQKEECPTTKKIHWQGYAEFNTPIRMKRFMKLLNFSENGRCFVRQGTRDEAKTYCMKEKSRLEKYIEYGDWDKGGQGTRNDLRSLLDLVKQGFSTIEIIDSNPVLFGRYIKTIDRYKAEYLKETSKTFRELEVIVLWGDAGIGKSRTAREEDPNLYTLVPDDTTLWWDGYEGEKTILIDDFYGQIKYSKLLHILDGYQLRLPIKGSFTYANWNKVYITSNKPPEEWYTLGLTDALKRRIKVIRRMGVIENPMPESSL